MLMVQPVLDQKAECSTVRGLEQQMARSPLVTNRDQTLKTQNLPLPTPQKNYHGRDACCNHNCDVTAGAPSVQATIFQQP